MIGRGGVIGRRGSVLLRPPSPHSAPLTPALAHHVDGGDVARGDGLLPLSWRPPGPGYHGDSRVDSLTPETSNQI